jgi:hypothetical protein
VRGGERLRDSHFENGLVYVGSKKARNFAERKFKLEIQVHCGT